jgi:hypothetical protein
VRNRDAPESDAQRSAGPDGRAKSSRRSLFEFGNPRTRAINLPCSSLERDFCRRRLAHQNGPEDDVSAQRPAIGDHQKWPQKAALLLASYQLRVSGDWVVAGRSRAQHGDYTARRFPPVRVVLTAWGPQAPSFSSGFLPFAG